MRRGCLILAMLLFFTGSAGGEVSYKVAREGMGWGLVAIGLVAGVLSAALVLENPSSTQYPAQRAAGWSAVGLSGVALLCGVLTLNVPPRRSGRLAFTATGLAVRF
jgi:hypothetical protein